MRYLVLLLTLAPALAWAQPAAEPVEAPLCKSTVLRYTPNEFGERIAALPASLVVRVLGETEDGFHRVAFGDAEGWVEAEALECDPDEAAQPARRPSQARRSGRCCKVCRKGKPCGDSCIARNKTCRKSSGCAC